MTRSLIAAIALACLCAAIPLCAQDDDVSLGDVARSLRKPKPANEVVIDNDNLPVMMDKAQAERLEGKPIFSIDPAGKAFRMTSPDGSCSLSFDARATALISTPFVATNLPQDELLKLDGEAMVRNSILQVSVHNGTAWELKEIVVAVTILEQPLAPTLQTATLSLPIELSPQSKSPDTTFLYHLKPVDPTGKYLYVANYGSTDVSQYTIDSTTGSLKTITATTPTAGTNPSFIVFDPGGKYLFVVNVGSKSITELKMNSDGSLSNNGVNTIQVGAVPRALALTH